jgi:hypothetical protein
MEQEHADLLASANNTRRDARRAADLQNYLAQQQPDAYQDYGAPRASHLDHAPVLPTYAQLHSAPRHAAQPARGYIQPQAGSSQYGGGGHFNPNQGFFNAPGGRSNSPRRSYRKELHLPTYSGDNQVKDSIEWFLQKVDSTALMNRWDDYETAEHVKVILTGAAGITVLTADEADKDKWSSLKEVLYRRFVPEGQSDRYESEFRGRSLKPSETFEGYAAELKMLLLRWQPFALGAAKDAALLSQFCLGINDIETGKRIKSTPGMTLTQAVNVASSSKGFSQMMNSRTMGKPAPSVMTMGMDYQSYDCGRVYNSSAQRSSTNPFADAVCGYCGGRGHWARDCVSGDDYVPSPKPFTDHRQSRPTTPGRSSSGGSKSSGGSSFKERPYQAKSRSRSGARTPASQGYNNKGSGHGSRSATPEPSSVNSTRKSPNEERPRKDTSEMISGTKKSTAN